MNTSRHGRRGQQRGVAALLVTTLLCFAMLLVVAYANRNVIVEVRASANQVRASQAREAAEAGIEWALARLDDDRRVGTDCLPSGDAGAASSRDRWLRFTAAAGDVTPATWSDAGTLRPLRAACVRTDSGWTCSCPAIGAPTLPDLTGDAVAPAFVVEFAAGARPGLIDVVATGCVAGNDVCNATTGEAHEATSRLQASFALLAAIRSAPVATLTVRGSVDAGSAALGLHNRDSATGGLAVHAGGAIAASALRLTAPDGSSLADTLVGNDLSLETLGADAFFARFFGMAMAAWSTQPAVTRIACHDDCTRDLTEGVAAGHRLLFIDGDAAIAGPATLGTTGDPIALVVRGELRLRGAIAIGGLVHAGSLRWDDATAPAATLRGAALVAGDYRGNGAADITHDSDVLSLLKTRRGSFVRVAGSWKDF